jgi:hypothetical protein
MAVLRSCTFHLLVWFVLLGLPWAGRGAEAVPPYQLKAAFLYNFIKFVEWPPKAFQGTQSPYVIGVVGKDPFGPVLDETFRGKTVNGRPLAVRRMVSDENISECHVLFISSSERRRLRQILDKIGTAPVLTVADMEDFSGDGGMIEFVTEGAKIRFHINLEASRNAGLKIHSTLLNLAKIVRKE